LVALKHIFIPNRETGALCAMKEAEIFLDDPKSAESIKQLEQVFLHQSSLCYYYALYLLRNTGIGLGCIKCVN
jgi:hypothetical protein